MDSRTDILILVSLVDTNALDRDIELKTSARAGPHVTDAAIDPFIGTRNLFRTNIATGSGRIKRRVAVGPRIVDGENAGMRGREVDHVSFEHDAAILEHQLWPAVEGRSQRQRGVQHECWRS